MGSHDGEPIRETEAPSPGHSRRRRRRRGWPWAEGGEWL